MNDKTELVAKNDAEQTPPVRKPYVVPVLYSWGSLKDLTMASGNSGASDGGGGRGGRGPNRTR